MGVVFFMYLIFNTLFFYLVCCIYTLLSYKYTGNMWSGKTFRLATCNIGAENEIQLLSFVNLFCLLDNSFYFICWIIGIKMNQFFGCWILNWILYIISWLNYEFPIQFNSFFFCPLSILNFYNPIQMFLKHV